MRFPFFRSSREPQRERNGFLAAFILIFLSILFLYLFSYSQTLSSHLHQLKQVQISAMCVHLALGCANTVAQVMEKETNAIWDELSSGHSSRFSYLLQRRLDPGEKVDIPIPDANFAKYEKVLKEIMNKTDLEGNTFSCEKFRIFFQDVTPFFYGAEPGFDYHDYLEKQGYITVEITVRSVQNKNIAKTVRLQRPFKQINILPPYFSRFALFVARTPNPEAYNVVSHTPGKGAFPRPFKILSGSNVRSPKKPESFNPGNFDLHYNGWIAIGGVPGTTDLIPLNLAEGYLTDPTGQMFLLGDDPRDDIMVRDDTGITGVKSLFNTSDFPVVFFRLFEGISTEKQREFNRTRQYGEPIPEGVSWLQLYGSRDEFTRTMVLGPVLGRFLKSVSFGPFGWKPKGDNDIEAVTPDEEKFVQAYKRRLQAPHSGFDGSRPLGSEFAEIERRAKKAKLAMADRLPTTWGHVFPNAALYPQFASGYHHLPFNAFFDLCISPGNDYRRGGPIRDLVPANEVDGLAPSYLYSAIDRNDRRFISQGSIRHFIQTVSQADSGEAYLAPEYLGYDHPSGFFRVRSRIDFFQTRHVMPALYEQRGTMKIQLQGNNPAEEAESFKTQLLEQGNHLLHSGIILVARAPGLDRPAPLVLPSNLMFHQNAALVFTRGDVMLDGVARGKGRCLLSIVAEEGAIHVTKKPIQAFLVAMDPGAPGRSPGKLVSRDGAELNVFGGIAVQELGVPAAGDPAWKAFFQEGGTLEYNYLFNPCLYTQEDYYRIFVSDCSPLVEVTDS